MNDNINSKIDNMNNLVELHLHLDGALSINNCRKIAKIQNIDIPNDDNETSKKIDKMKEYAEERYYNYSKGISLELRMELRIS